MNPMSYNAYIYSQAKLLEAPYKIVSENGDTVF